MKRSTYLLVALATLTVTAMLAVEWETQRIERSAWHDHTGIGTLRKRDILALGLHSPLRGSTDLRRVYAEFEDARDLPFSDQSDASKWRLGDSTVEPPRAEALNLLLSEVVSLNRATYLAPESIKNFSSLGLKPIDTTLTVDYAGGRFTVGFGAPHPSGARRYATISSRQGVFLVSERLYQATIADPRWYRAEPQEQK